MTVDNTPVFSTYQARVREWTKHCFGDEVDLHRETRQVQLLEEVLELLQAAGLPKGTVISMVDIVYGKEAGDIYMEAGDVMSSMAAFCTTHSINMVECAESTLCRCIQNTDKIRLKQTGKPFHKKK